MKKLTLAAFAAVLLAGTAPASAKLDCDAGYKDFLTKYAKGIEQMSASWLADAGRKSAEAFAACKAGDEYGPYGVWQNLVAEMDTHTKKAGN